MCQFSQIVTSKSVEIYFCFSLSVQDALGNTPHYVGNALFTVKLKFNNTLIMAGILQP